MAISPILIHDLVQFIKHRDERIYTSIHALSVDTAREIAHQLKVNSPFPLSVKAYKYDTSQWLEVFNRRRKTSITLFIE